MFNFKIILYALIFRVYQNGLVHHLVVIVTRQVVPRGREMLKNLSRKQLT